MRLALRSSAAVYPGLLDMATRNPIDGSGLVALPRSAFAPDDGLARTVDGAGHLAQRELAERCEVLVGEKILERRFDLVLGVDLPFAQPVAKIFSRNVEIDHLVRGAHHPIRHRLPDRHPQRRGDDVIERFQMLDIERGDDVDPGVEQLRHVLPALAVVDAGNVGVRQLVDDRDLGARADDGGDVPTPRA